MCNFPVRFARRDMRLFKYGELCYFKDILRVSQFQLYVLKRDSRVAVHNGGLAAVAVYSYACCVDVIYKYIYNHLRKLRFDGGILNREQPLANTLQIKLKLRAVCGVFKYRYGFKFVKPVGKRFCQSAAELDKALERV